MQFVRGLNTGALDTGADYSCLLNELWWFGTCSYCEEGKPPRRMELIVGVKAIPPVKATGTRHSVAVPYDRPGTRIFTSHEPRMEHARLGASRCHGRFL